MAASTITIKLSLLLSFLLSVSLLGVRSDTHQNAGTIPPTCKHIECPTYDVIQVGNGYEIRRYSNSTVWMSNSPIQDISLVEATRTGFRRLFDYIQGRNNYKQKIEMTAPVITEVSPSDGPFCESSFVVSFLCQKRTKQTLLLLKVSMPKDGNVYIAARQFGGYVTDSNVGVEAAALQASIAGTD